MARTKAPAPPLRIRRGSPTPTVQLTPEERAAQGKTARAVVPRDSQSVFDPPPDRPDPVRIAIAAYFGGGDVFDQAITRFAAAYADQTERDHEALAKAAASGRIHAESGV